MNVNVKAWYKSKTLILNALAAGLAALEVSTGALKPVLGESGLYVALSVGLPVANAMLRIVTKQPIRRKKKPRVEAPTDEN
jgi:hypothetical protein